ncbi:hypothetical protein WOLCODRAFT_163166 [Wolfiporia cocos MD-104 SS10]|uniref:VWFA domain-containing protein n=1 Tax=Wolfiporia cocos (strain MD-104) TaxID=742152 RepID=A0A2H3JRV2_WOLCO|nr:hypothetical protein WOLCODRAFT_163166 [Wolfiporia cocos MD-104 SS10]
MQPPWPETSSFIPQNIFPDSDAGRSVDDLPLNASDYLTLNSDSPASQISLTSIATAEHVTSHITDSSIQDDLSTPPRDVPLASTDQNESGSGLSSTTSVDADNAVNDEEMQRLEDDSQKLTDGRSAFRDVRPPETDLVGSISGMYRILDLISEQGSGGLVDKIVIAQEPLGRLINDLCPGAYTSMTKVDFATLDRLAIKPVGIYGSKSEIVRFLRSRNAVNDATAATLLSTQASQSCPTNQPTLRSGIYILRILNTTASEHGRDPQDAESFYTIYWPEDTTWDDKPMPSARRNRTTFMRYLMKISDQVVALISEDDAAKIIWQEEIEDIQEKRPDDDDDDERLFTFEVTKTLEQEENAVARPGFSMEIPPELLHSQVESDAPSNSTLLKALLVPGDTAQGLLSVAYKQAESRHFSITDSMNPLRLRSFIDSHSLRLSEDMSATSLGILMQNGLDKRVKETCDAYRTAVEAAHTRAAQFVREKVEAMIANFNAEQPQLQWAVQQKCVDIAQENYPTLEREAINSALPPAAAGSTDASDKTHKEYLKDCIEVHPDIGVALNKIDTKRFSIRLNPIKKPMKRILILTKVLPELGDAPPGERSALVNAVLNEGLTAAVVDALRNVDATEKQPAQSIWRKMTAVLFGGEGGDLNQRLMDAEKDALSANIPTFIAKLPDIVANEPLLAEAAAKVTDVAIDSLKQSIEKETNTLAARLRSIQERECKRQFDREAAVIESQGIETARIQALQDCKDRLIRHDAKDIFVVQQVVEEIHRWNLNPSYRITGHRETYAEPALRYTLYPLQLLQDDQHRLQLDASYVPTPRIHRGAANSFELPMNHKIILCRLLSDGRVLLIVDDSRGNVTVFLEQPSAMEAALKRRAVKKTLNREKIGDYYLIAFEEEKRMLAVLGNAGAGRRLQLYIFVFDETYAALQGLGSSIDLGAWYDGAVTIAHIAFVCGSEELVIVDGSARVRIFSVVTQQFRPASLQLEQAPRQILSSPDGSCLLTLHEAADGFQYIRAFHWSTFGTSEGIPLGLCSLKAGKLEITSLLKRTSVHLMSLDFDESRCNSVALDITRKTTEFMFQESGRSSARNMRDGKTAQNCFVDCHAEVWIRFPVVPAVQRQTIKASAWRCRRAILFVTGRDHASYRPYFAEKVSTFERTTRKPTGTELSDIIIEAVDYAAFIDHTIVDISCFRAGEWLVDLLCLIPIHIAVTRDNRFIPLKDGVWSAELERSLLGADVARIVDCLSFGWYEPIFQSYMAAKKVKVVSSMGEQSVGKSFALNHLVDTSFAGSAMRTTEGVWMSVAPLDDVIIVALDFEGVHSIERSAQEDTLLVLFNTAISNLVLFRNNFALSRDITGLFKSFQSSSSVLDPKANPTLFQSTLVIIIKDVVDNDANEIVKEFSLKFQQIVQQEQGSNFISQLHKGKLAIIPWPVIESRQFYTLFGGVRRHLDKQETTHPRASMFLQTLKTLMAKLKANDWGALSQNMAAHRAQLLLTFLPKALAIGATEIAPEFEPLKDYDTGEIIDNADTPSLFWLSELATSDLSSPTGREETLQQLIRSWEQFPHNTHRSADDDKDWVDSLDQFLSDRVQLRVEHVEEWLRRNTARLPDTHADLQNLRRAASNMIIDLRSSVQLCGLQCATCHLSCIRGRYHDGQHDCQTSHRCSRACQFEDHEDEKENCGLPAGHPGSHICNIAEHLCGKLCALHDRSGCLQHCTKVVDHPDDEHMCSATVHECGEICALANVTLPSGDIYTCQDKCRASTHEPHEHHVCGNRQCPLQCQLCKRLCDSQNHLHALEPGALHLCGQEHACDKLCSADGICQIDTKPQSIEATFTGRHETFQYTKYSQVSKRLKCIIPITPGRMDHEDIGPHRHTSEKDPFHFCEARCENCGYFCTLRRGHPQQEHETSHGSMSKTQWAIDGPDGTSVELDGRKFATSDEGAPMLCSLFCRSMGRHLHIDWCRTDPGDVCSGPDHEHIKTRMQPHPQREKDWVNHSLYWRRTGFKDPYPHEDQVNFALCDAMCPGQEHAGAGRSGAPQPSHCILPILHARYTLDQPFPGNGLGYISNDGHAFNCRNPAVLQQAFHVIFAIDRSGSMAGTDRRPLSDRPSTRLLTRQHNNRLGAVYSSLDAFWIARHTAVNAGGQAGAAIRRDAYTVLLFDHDVTECLANDFTSTPDQLLNAVKRYSTGGGTNFTAAIQSCQALMERHWSTDRNPVVIFLSDGECGIADNVVQNLCLRSIALGKALSFHAVSFGPRSHVLQRMAQIAVDVQGRAPPDPLNPSPTSTYAEALDSVRLAETFLGIAESLRKPRGSLIHC